MSGGGPARALLPRALAGIAAVLVLAAAPSLVESPPAPDPAVGKAPVATDPATHRKVPPDLLGPFRGLSSWIDTYDTALTPEQQVAAAAAGGVQTLFVQSARPSTEGLLHDADRLARTIDAAHDAGIAVVTWTVPDLVDLDHDRAQALAAMAFTTPRGDTPDGFGLDIEVDAIEFVPVRNRRLLQLSHELRAHAGPRYPMAAIVLPPKQLELNTTWWPGFPYADLAGPYDVMVPMSYSSYRGADAVLTHEWNRDNVHLLRELTGDPHLPVHLAGGIADALPEVEAFVRAAVDGDVVGAGLYDLHTTRPEAWPALQALRVG